MTAEQKDDLPRGFSATVLPLIVAAATFLVYLATLNRWIALGSLGTVAQVSGWTWQAQLQQPLNFLVFYPFRFVPAVWRPLALNIFTAACAALVLALLTRSVALLPHDRTREQRWREPGEDYTLAMPTAWMPPVLAALACGLQLTFWENATSATGAVLSLLVFAAVIWCLLEFRISQSQAWLSASAFLYAAGMTNDWQMIGLFPMFLAAVLWLKGFAFFNLRFLVRMALWAAAGLSLYLVLPAVCVFKPDFHLDFWTALKANLRFQWVALNSIPHAAVLVFGLSCALPLLFLSICWRTASPHAGDDNPVTGFITKSMFCLAHGAFLAASLWLALDPLVSPRHLAGGALLLDEYYLSALVIGYCSGYLLLVGSVPIARLRRFQKRRWSQPFVAMLTIYAFALLLLLVPVALLWRNLGQLRTTNGPALHEFATEIYRSLPPGKSVVLSEQPVEQFLLLGELAAHASEKDALVLDVHSLFSHRYQAIKAGEFRARWPLALAADGTAVVGFPEVLHLLSRFAAREPLIYLQPSFSFCFEQFAGRPEGCVLYLAPQTRDALGRKLDARLTSAGEQYWQQLWNRDLSALPRQTVAAADFTAGPDNPVAARLHLVAEPNQTRAYLAGAYSKLLNCWGVLMQRQGHWPEAGVWFKRAFDLRPDNLSARINLEFNSRHQAGNQQRLDREAVEKDLLNLFARHRKWETVMNDDGPVDEPTFLFETGRVLLAGGRPRQAVREFARCTELAPDWQEPRLWLAQGHVAAREFASALHLTDEILAAELPGNGSGLAQLLFCRASALTGLGHTNEAVAVIGRFVSQYPEAPEVLSTASQLYLREGQYQPALGVLERLLTRDPSNPELLSNKGIAELELARYDVALATLNAALTLAPSNQVVRLNRAIANLRAGNLDAAQADYQQLLRTAPDSFEVLFGLAEIAWRRHETNTAVQFYQKCLPHAGKTSLDYRLVTRRLKELKVEED